MKGVNVNEYRLPLFRALHGGRSPWFASQIPLLVGVACLVVFFVSFPAKSPADGLLFYAQANFDSYAAGEWDREGVSALVVSGFPVAPKREIDEDVSYTPGLQEMELHVTPDVRAYSKIFADVDLSSEHDSQDIALLDTDSARAMGIEPGEHVGLLFFGFASTDDPVFVTVGALTAPYPWVNDQGHGLLIVPNALVPRQVIAELEASQGMFPSERRTYFVEPDPAPTMGQLVSRKALRTRFLSEFLSSSFLPGYLAVLMVATLLWGAVIGRIGAHADRASTRRRAILNATGSSQRDLIFVAVAGDLVIISIVCFAAIGVVSEVIYGRLINAELSALSAVPAAGVLALPVVVTLLARTRRLRRHMASGALLPSLAAAGGDR